MSTKGYDYFVVEPASVEVMHCSVCQTACRVERNVYGPTSFATAMAKDFRLHDIFVCPFADTPWHEQALQLVVAIEETPSKRVAQLMQQDLAELLHEQNLQPHSG